MKRQKLNGNRSRKKFAAVANRTHKMNKLPSSAFIKRGGVRL